MTLNAYVYDFWLHGNVRRLCLLLPLRELVFSFHMLTLVPSFRYLPQSRIIEEDNELTTHQQYDKLRAFKNHLTLFAQAVSKRAKGDKRDENQVVRARGMLGAAREWGPESMPLHTRSPEYSVA